MNQFHVGPMGYAKNFEPPEELLDQISQIITHHVNDTFGRVMITSVDHSVISPVYKSKRDNYVPQWYMEDPSELPQRIIQLTIDTIASDIKSHFYREEKHQYYSIWNTVLGTANNQAGLVGHDFLKTRQNPLHASSGMRY